LPQGSITTTRENRFIATFDHLNLMLYSNPNFDDYYRDHTKQANGALIGGFHLVPTLDRKPVMYEKAKQIRPWKEASPEIYIRSEMGSFQRTEIMRYLLDNLPSDSIGMNEDELSALRNFDPCWSEIMDAARDLIHGLGISRACIHTKDYVISVSTEIIRPEDEVEALIHGTN